MKWLIPSAARRRLRLVAGGPRGALDYLWLTRARAIMKRLGNRSDLDKRQLAIMLAIMDFQRHRALANRPAGLWTTIDFSKVLNSFPNSGPIPVKEAFKSAREVVDAFPDPTKRRQSEGEYAGFAPDDAIFDEATQAWELWSNAGLGWFLAAFAYIHYAAPSVLDLGCGPAHLWYFLRLFGIGNYLGVDGNPYLIELSSRLHADAVHFRILDLQQRCQFTLADAPLCFDIICSFELLEHIHEDYVDELLWTMRRHMHQRSVLFCTASLQEEMDVHVLVRPRDWWLERFANAGLRPRRDEDRLCSKLLENQPFNWGNRTNVFALEASAISPVGDQG